MNTTHNSASTRLIWLHRISTALLVAWMLSSGLMALLKAPPILQAIAYLGYPAYFIWLLGLSKLGEAALMVLPVPAGLRSWAYAASTFEVLAAAFSYAAAGAEAAEVVVPLGFLALIQGSFWSWQRRLAVRQHAPMAVQGFDVRKVQDQGFVKLYRTLEVGPHNLRALQTELSAGTIKADADLFLVAVADAPAIAVTLWNLAYHHLAQGVLEGGRPFLLSFCPVCNSGMVFDPRVDGQGLTFRVGGVYRGTMIMCDEQTGSFWDHITGVCLGGVMAGKSLEVLGSHRIERAGDAVLKHPSLRVAMPKLGTFLRWMTRFQNGHTWRALPEGKFYPGFKASFVFEDARRPEKELGLGVWVNQKAKFYPLADLRRLGTLRDEVGGVEVELNFDRHLGVPSARRLGVGAEVCFVFARWYGFAQTFPGCELYLSSTAAELRA